MSSLRRCLVVALVAVISPAAALSKEAPRQARPVQPIAAVKFDPSWSAFPKGFGGDSIVALTKALADEKSEFETTADYMARVESALDPSRRYVFVLDHKQDLNLLQLAFDPKYDAEQKAYLVDVQPALFPTPDTEVCEPFTIAYKSSTKGGYTGTNVMGARRDVKVVDASRWSICVPKKRVRPIHELVSVSGSEAPKWKGDLRLAFVVTVAQVFPQSKDETLSEPGRDHLNPYLWKGTRNKEPTFEVPRRLHQVDYWLGAVLEQVWIFRASNGAIVSKLDLSEATKD